MRFFEGFEAQWRNLVAPSFSIRGRKHIDSQFVIEAYCRCSWVEVVEVEGSGKLGFAVYISCYR